ncbi:TRAP transporter substrate-binding protein [Lutimaribacter marinistellae]|uniref:TRAP transporter substrate-binding protein n=1 Tax=Lutimaribacter marinistellae TaxID=1820329 RepID=A0ABV7TCZ4_9RHOB
MTLNRRTFFRNTAVAGLGATAATLAAPAIAQGKRQLTMVMAWPHNFPGLASIAYNWGKAVEELSDGNITVKVNAAGELVGAFEVFDAVGQGTADAYHASPMFLAGKWQAATFFGLVPFGLNAMEHCAWMYHGGGQELQDKAYRDLLNLKAFTCGHTGTQMAGWFNEEINSLDDFQGIKMRSSGIAGEVMRRVGASAVMIPPQEIFTSLQSGAIDATELCCAWLDSANGFHQYAKYYYTPGWQEVNSAGEIGLNADLWDEFSDHEKKIMEHAAKSANSINIGEWPYYNAKAMETLRTEHGVEVRGYPDDVVLALAKTAQEVVAELAESDDYAAEIYASWKAYRDEAMQYSALVDYPLYKARKMAFEAGA